MASPMEDELSKARDLVRTANELINVDLTADAAKKSSCAGDAAVYELPSFSRSGSSSISETIEGLDLLCDHLRTLSWPNKQEIRQESPRKSRLMTGESIQTEASRHENTRASGLDALLGQAAHAKEQLLQWLPARGTRDLQNCVQNLIESPINRSVGARGARSCHDDDVYELDEDDQGLDGDALAAQVDELDRRIQQEKELQRLSRLEHAWQLAARQDLPQFRNVCSVFSDLTDAHHDLEKKNADLQRQCDAEDRSTELLKIELERIKATLADPNCPVVVARENGVAEAVAADDVINKFLNSLVDPSTSPPSMSKLREAFSRGRRLPKKSGAGPLPQFRKAAPSISLVGTASSDVDLMTPPRGTSLRASQGWEQSNLCMGGQSPPTKVDLSWQSMAFTDFALHSSPALLPRSPLADSPDQASSLSPTNGIGLPSGPWRPSYSTYSEQLVEPMCSLEPPSRREPKPPGERAPGTGSGSPNPRARQFWTTPETGQDAASSAAMLMAALTPSLEFVTLSSAPATAVALDWGHSYADHLTVSRVEVRVWEVNRASLVRFLSKQHDDGVSVFSNSVECDSVAVVKIPWDQIKDQTASQQNVLGSSDSEETPTVYASRLLCQKIVPAHLGKADAPAPIVIDSLPAFLAVVVRIRLSAAHAVPRNEKPPTTAWGHPLIVVRLGTRLDVGNLDNAAALATTLQGAVVDEVPSITVKAWR